MRTTWMILGAAGVALAVPRPADACSPPLCWPAAFVPADGAHVPANVPGLYWRPMSGFGASAKPENVVLESVAAPGVSIALTAQLLPNGDYLLVPATALVAGNSYRLTDRSTCAQTGDRGPEVVFQVGPAAPMPSRLGALSAAAVGVIEMNLATRSGSCFSPATVAQTSIELVPDSAAALWVDALLFDTLVDGKPWHYYTSINVQPAPGTSPAGRARDRVYAVCASKDPGVGEGLAAGRHVVKMQATLPGTTDVVMSESVDVTLSCTEAPKDPGSGSGSDSDSDGSGCSAGGRGVAGGMALVLIPLIRRRSRGSAGSSSVPAR